MKLYVYCLSDEMTPRLIKDVVGLAGARVRLAESESIAAVVSDFDDERIAVTAENVRAHERVVRRVLSETTPLPFRFGTLVSEARLRSYLETQAEALKAQLARVRGCVEWSVKVIWHPQAFKSEAERVESKTPDKKMSESGIGTAFLEKKRREILGERPLRERATEIAGWLDERLKTVVREAHTNVQPGESLVLAASHLVERARLEEYRAALKGARAERSELHFLTSGAWPPYSFTSAGS